MTEPPLRVPLADVRVDDVLVGAAEEALRSAWWSMGPRVAEFERAFAELCRAKHAFAVANGTAALHLALLATDCGPGDEVILPSLNFVAAANVILHVGATPVFCDIQGPDDLNLDPDDVEAAITPATKAILLLHYGGFPCNVERARELADRRGLVLLEDAAHAPGASAGGQMCGTFGQIGCFSFFSNKNLPLGEGGMIVTNDDELADRVRLLRSHGMTALTWDRHRGHAHTYDVLREGFNYRLDEIRAAMGVVQLGRLLEENAARGRISKRYREALEELDGLTMPMRESDGRVSSHHLAVALLPEGLPREPFREQLRGKGIQTSVHYPPIHGFTRYETLPNPRSLPRTDEVAERIVTLPLFGHMRDDQVDEVVRAVRAAARPSG